jgi:hypothetical protein
MQLFYKIQEPHLVIRETQNQKPLNNSKTTKIKPEKDLREEKSNLLDSMELDGDKGVTAANPWKSVAIGSEKKNGNEGLERKVYEFICL